MLSRIRDPGKAVVPDPERRLPRKDATTVPRAAASIATVGVRTRASRKAPPWKPTITGHVAAAPGEVPRMTARVTEVTVRIR